jgi:hypothetical protein
VRAAPVRAAPAVRLAEAAVCLAEAPVVFAPDLAALVVRVVVDFACALVEAAALRAVVRVALACGAADLAAPARALGAADLAVPDFAALDLAVPDLAVPDLAVPALAALDLAVPDFAVPDFAALALALGAADLLAAAFAGAADFAEARRRDDAAEAGLDGGFAVEEDARFAGGMVGSCGDFSSGSASNRGESTRLRRCLSLFAGNGRPEPRRGIRHSCSALPMSHSSSAFWACLRFSA